MLFDLLQLMKRRLGWGSRTKQAIEPDPISLLALQLGSRRDDYKKQTLESPDFQNALQRLDQLGGDFLEAQSYVRMQGTRFAASDDHLMFRFAPQLAESVLAVSAAAREGMQNSARRELRFLLEAAVKYSACDFSNEARTLEERRELLRDKKARFRDWVSRLYYFEDFAEIAEANSQTLALYSELSSFVHASWPLTEQDERLRSQGESLGMESLATLNRFNELAFAVYDIVLVRIFHGVGVSMAGDIFTTILDDDVAWIFHKGRFMTQLSKCFDYKHERQERLKRD